MIDDGYNITDKINDADIIFLNTCSVRDNAEEKIHNRIKTIFHLIKKRKYPTVFGILGCMAERLQEQLLNNDNLVNLVVGPDEYKKLPELVKRCFSGSKEIATDLSQLEDYNDIVPYRSSGIADYISIMRGCNNYCAFCVVPYTRGRERSRPVASIIKEVELLCKQSTKEIMLLGQNVNNYHCSDVRFHSLLEQIAKAYPNL